MKKYFFAVLLLLYSTTLFSQGAIEVQVETLSKSTLSWDGNTLPNYKQGTPELTILKIKIPPGASLPPHRHPVINAGYLLSGELTVVTEKGTRLHLKAGESLIEVVDILHYGKNEGKNTAEILVFYAGIKGAPITIKKEAWEEKK
jgi:quercetin dioxygenase-like cupin family protein